MIKVKIMSIEANIQFKTIFYDAFKPQLKFLIVLPKIVLLMYS